ncbi:MAG TPA: six-cysteine peptide SCIFF [Clostridiales bacterium]|jgi:predicted ribosomally synthesized six-cysteine peptide SCIFF|nr:six-cysteine peptide SCIFF [Clostridiales bacterium]
MKHIKIIAINTIDRSQDTGCGECQASCQSACKTSCTVGNQACEKKITRNPKIKANLG